MQAPICVAPFASLPISTPQTSVLLLERACWRICRTTSLSMRTEGVASFFCFDITQPLLRARQAPLPCRRQANTQFRVAHCVPRKYRNEASRAYPVSERHRIHCLCNRERSPRPASVHHVDTAHPRTESHPREQIFPAVRGRPDTPACESHRG